MRHGAAVLCAMAVVLLGGCELTEALTEQVVGADIEIDDRSPAPSSAPETVGPESTPGEQSFPDALPQELPLPAGMDVLEDETTEADDGTRVRLTANYDGEYDRAVAFYDVELAAAGWQVTSTEELGVEELGDEDLDGKRWNIEGFGTSGSVEVRQVPDPDDEGPQTNVVVDLESVA